MCSILDMENRPLYFLGMIMLISLVSILNQIRMGNSIVRGPWDIIMSFYGKILVFWKFAIRKTYKPLIGPLLGNVTLPIPILVWVRVPIYIISISLKPYRFKEIRDCRNNNCNRKRLSKVRILPKRNIFWPRMGSLFGIVTIPTPIPVWVRAST